MKEKQLLSLMFSDAAEFREQLLGETLQRVRRKRRVRRCGQALLTLALAAFTVWWIMPRRVTFDSPASTGIQIVYTRPLPAERIITTQQSSVTMIATDKSTLALLEDEQLLDLVPGETKLLVWHAPHQAELVIVGP